MDPNAAVAAADAGYTSYPDATDPQGGYAQPPFSGQPQQFGGELIELIWCQIISLLMTIHKTGGQEYNMG